MVDAKCIMQAGTVQLGLLVRAFGAPPFFFCAAPLHFRLSRAACLLLDVSLQLDTHYTLHIVLVRPHDMQPVTIQQGCKTASPDGERAVSEKWRASLCRKSRRASSSTARGPAFNLPVNTVNELL